MGNTPAQSSLIKIKGYLGISAGCFLGTGYGLVFGFGTPFYYKFGICTVIPSRNLFFHTGYISGCFVGLTVGTGFTTGINCTFGKEEYIEVILEKAKNMASFLDYSTLKLLNEITEKFRNNAKTNGYLPKDESQ